MVCGGVFKQAAFAATGRTLVHSVLDWCRNTATRRGAEPSIVLRAVLASGSTPYRPKVGCCQSPRTKTRADSTWQGRCVETRPSVSSSLGQPPIRSQTCVGPNLNSLSASFPVPHCLETALDTTM